MCDFCGKHKRKKWFLDADNFKEKMLESTKRLNVLKKLAGHGMGYYMRDSSELMKWLDVPLVDKVASVVLNKMGVAEHSGQVVNPTDAIEILKLADNHVCFECICRKMCGAKTQMCCINFGPMRDLVKWASPTEKMEEIDTAEAIYRVKDFQKQGLVSEVLYGAAPFPIALCSCERKYCAPMKDRFAYNFPLAYIKGHEVAVVNPSLCRNCTDFSCMSKCQFGSMFVDRSEGSVIIDVTKCFGCGLCALGCPKGAIELFDREKIIKGKDKW